jgi:hypothetical protein
MRKVIRKFIVWVMGANEERGLQLANRISTESTSTSADSRLRLGFIKAMNGTIIEVSSHKQNPHGPDWKHELYIVREGESLGDAIKVILATKALEQ